MKPRSKWKAVKFRPIMDMRKFFDRRFDIDLAASWPSLGYEIETKFKADGQGGGKYFTWDIKGIPDSVVAKAARGGRPEVDATEAAIVAERKEAKPGRRRTELSAVARDKLGATSRREKRDDLTLERMPGVLGQPASRRRKPRTIAETIQRAMPGPRTPGRSRGGTGRWISPCGTISSRNSAVPLEELRHDRDGAQHGRRPRPPTSSGKPSGRASSSPSIDGERWRPRAELSGRRKTWPAIAAAGRGTVARSAWPRGCPRRLAGGKALNDGQWEAACGLLQSENRVNLVEGPAGAGKSSLLRKFDEGMQRAGQSGHLSGHDRPTPSGCWQKDGFEANTVARFLLDEKMQAGGHAAAGSSSMKPRCSATRTRSSCSSSPKRLDLKLIFVGDPMQHGSVPAGP